MFYNAAESVGASFHCVLYKEAEAVAVRRVGSPNVKLSIFDKLL